MTVARNAIKSARICCFWLRRPLGLTVTVNVQELDCPALSVAVQRTVVSPTGKVLPGTRPPAAPPPSPTNFDPSRQPPPPPPPDPVAAPVVVTSTGRALPELGESNSTAQQMAVARLARQIVNMMERPW